MIVTVINVDTLMMLMSINYPDGWYMNNKPIIRNQKKVTMAIKFFEMI